MHESMQEFLDTAQRHYRSTDENAPKHMAEAAERMRSRMSEMMAETVDASDNQGFVNATTTLAGKLEGMKISVYAMRDLDTIRLGQACKEAISNARSKAASRFDELIGEHPGELIEELKNPASSIQHLYLQ